MNDSGDNEKLDTATVAAPRAIVLVGNPNVGKSVLFSKLTGKYVTVSNYPGTTVEITRSESVINGAPHTVLDTPGVNELTTRTEDARVTCDVLRDHPDATIVQVADAKNLRRALLLTFQLAHLRRPMVLVLNMMDELGKCGGKIDLRKLSELLGIPVVPTIATAGTGIHLLQKNIEAATVPRIFIDDPAAASDARTYEQTAAYLEQANNILADTYSLRQPHRPRFGQKLGWWSTHPFKGLLMLAGVLYFMFWFVGLLGAGTAVDFLETVVFGRYVSPLAIHTVDTVLPFPHEHETHDSAYEFEIPLTPTKGIPISGSAKSVLAPASHVTAGATLSWWEHVKRFIHDFLVGEYGAITMAISYALAIVLPIVTTFFLVFSVLEDSGYIPRLAVMLNRVMRSMGLNGKAVLPMVLGLGCDTMATMTTRILETRKERVITTLLLALSVPCSAQLGVLLAMMARISFAAAAFWVLLNVAVMIATGWLAARVLGGQSSDFILELPPMRRPQFSNVMIKTFARLEWYLKEVVPLFVLGTAALFLLDRVGLLTRIAKLGEPLMTGWLGLPAETASAFLVGFLRRDYGAVFLLDAATGPNAVLNAHQVLVAMVTITLFMPCIATLFMIARELGNKTAVLITLFVFPFAFFVGGVVHFVGKLVGL
jgi:ferrous iron transport protein B